jgi:hypothetical protein
MSTVRRVRSLAGSLASITVSSLVATTLALFGTGPAFAIPSPELVVGSIVSLSQLFALASAILGGGAAYATMRSRRNGSTVVSRGTFGLAVGLLILLIVSGGFNIYQYLGLTNNRQARLESTLLRPSRAPQRLVDAPTARELTFAQQNRHPLRMSAKMRSGRQGL